MRSLTMASEGSPAADPATTVGDRTRLLTWLAVAGIIVSILIMIAASALRNSWNSPRLVLPAIGLPWGVSSVAGSVGVWTVALWIATLAGGGGVIAGLVAVRRGARPSVKAILIAAGIALVALTVLPVAGSNDALDYATYGRIMVMGHSPYVMKPEHLILTHNAFASAIPGPWRKFASIYGPLATAEQFLAAKLGGLSAARITFWLKLWNSIAFALVAFVADRLLRGDPARRLRAHLLWTINPLLLWDVVAAGHLDVLAAAAGMLGLLALGRHCEDAPPPLLRVIAAGALIGVAVDVKANYVLFGLAAAWILRRSIAALAAGAAAALVVLAPGYAWFGVPAVHSLVARRNGLSADSMYRFLLLLPVKPVVGPAAAILVIAVAVLLFRRLPAAIPDRPAIWMALLLSMAWLFFWPYEFPWYDSMIICLLVLYPASRLDWLVLGRLAAATLANIPGNPNAQLNWLIGAVRHGIVQGVVPVVLLAAAVCLLLLARRGQWKLLDPGGLPGPAPATGQLMRSATR
jgi:alpha-1,6-mannosyltransferase